MRSAYDASCLRASDHYDPLDYIFFSGQLISL